jgi:hypothetical protein
VPAGVSPAASLTLKLFDSVPQTGFIFLDTDGDGTYGDSGAADAGSKADNTMCIDARNISGNCVEVSYDSRDDYLTFTGDNVVACRVAGEDIQCVGCKIGDICDISLTVEQTTVCDFDYETPAGTRACCVVGNRIVFQNNTGFFGDQPSDQYQVIATITNPTMGVAFGSSAIAVRVSDSTVLNLADCLANPGTPGSNITSAITTAYLADGITTVTSFNSGDCSLTASQMATVVATDPSAPTGQMDMVDDDNQMWVDLPFFVFDPTMVSASTTITVEIQLIKLPCTTVKVCTVDVGHFVDSCLTVVPSTYMFTIPYSTAINDPVWWSGAALSNCATDDADCTLTFNEMDGDVGTYTGTIPGGGMWVNLFSTILGDITQTAGNGSLGDESMFVCISCTGGNVKSFFLLGDGTQAQGSAIGTGCP